MSDIAGIFGRELAPLDRCVQIGVAGGKVVKLSFPQSLPDDATAEYDLLNRIEAYAAGRTEDKFDDVDIGLTVPTEQRSVLDTLRTVPYGESVTVEQLTRMSPGLDPDEDDDQRTVRSALSENPAPIVLPDHRVVDAGGATPPAVASTLRSVEGIDH